MFGIRRIKIRSDEIGLFFRDREFHGLLEPGVHWFVDLLGHVKVEIVSLRDPWLRHEKLDVIVKSGALKNHALVLDLKDHERALVWVDGRFHLVLAQGLYALWTEFRDVRVELVDAREHRFSHKDAAVITRSPGLDRVVEIVTIEAGHVGVAFIDGQFTELLSPGRHAFWKNVAQIKVVPVDLRETVLDVAGQDIMTADKVTLRLNALVTYRVRDARQSVDASADSRQMLYREVQLALRAVVGGRDLDAFLADKDAVVSELQEQTARRIRELGLEIISVGIRDVILPGEMKDLLNKVTEARKAAEANLISRREETSAIRSQANTAKLLQDNPVLMRMRELEVLEKIAASAQLKIVLCESEGDKNSLARRVTQLL